MSSLNKVMLIGNAGRDPESRTFPSGDMVANVSIATTEKWKDKQTGEAKEATEWHRLVFNGKLADIVCQYVRKGTQIYVEGRIQTRKYTDRDGAERQATEIRVDSMKLLGGRPDGAHGGGSRAPAPAPAARPQQRPAQRDDDLDRDVPF